MCLERPSQARDIWKTRVNNPKFANHWLSLRNWSYFTKKWCRLCFTTENYCRFLPSTVGRENKCKIHRPRASTSIVLKSWSFLPIPGRWQKRTFAVNCKKWYIVSKQTLPMPTGRKFRLDTLRPKNLFQFRSVSKSTLNTCATNIVNLVWLHRQHQLGTKKQSGSHHWLYKNSSSCTGANGLHFQRNPMDDRISGMYKNRLPFNGFLRSTNLN